MSCQSGGYQICDANQSSLFQSRADAYAHKEHYSEAIADLAHAVLWEKEPAQLAALNYKSAFTPNKGDQPLALQNYSHAIDYNKGSPMYITSVPQSTLNAAKRTKPTRTGRNTSD